MMSIINKTKSFLGYVWVALAISVSIMGFKDIGHYEQLIAQKSGLRLSENWSGGKIDAVFDRQTHQTVIRRPVFAGLISKSKNGFVQIEWRSSSKLPRVIHEEFDYDRDSRPDFTIHMDTLNNTAILKSYSNHVISIKDNEVLVFHNSRIIRVNIKK